MGWVGVPFIIKLPSTLIFIFWFVNFNIVPGSIVIVVPWGIAKLDNKYSLSEDYIVVIHSYVEAIYQTLKKDILITDRDKFITGISEYKKECENKDISDFLLRIIDKRVVKKENEKSRVTPSLVVALIIAFIYMVIEAIATTMM